MKIRHQNFFLIRRPLLPIDTILGLFDRCSDQEHHLDNELIRIFKQPVLLRAIYFASPDLYELLITDQQQIENKSRSKLAITLFKYLVRMSSRSTPFGLFAGCCHGTISEQTNIVFASEERFDLHLRLDMEYASELSWQLSQNPTIRQQLKFSPNTSLYKVGDTYRYVQSIVSENGKDYVVSAIETNEYLESVIEASTGRLTIEELIETIRSEDIEYNEAYDYLLQLIDEQVLVSDLEATVTGDEFYGVMVSKIMQLSGTEIQTTLLRKIQLLLSPDNYEITDYREVKSILNEEFLITKGKHLIQADLFYEPVSCTLKNSVVDSLSVELEELACLATPFNSHDLDQFRKAYAERYEGKEMPLLSVLDGEFGVGYAHLTNGKADDLPLINDVELPAPDITEYLPRSPVVRFKEDLYYQSLEQKTTVVDISPESLVNLKAQIPMKNSFPSSFFLFGSLIADSQAQLDRGNFKFSLKTMSGPSGLSLLARFCHGSSKLKELVLEAIKEEEKLDSEAIFAEIAHLPDARVGNVLMRPHFRRFEIPYLAGSSLPEDQQILPSDLMVSVSANNEIYLRSKTLNKRVHPRLTNAHNFSKGLPVYKFLCDLSYQGSQSSLQWDWSYLHDKPFLPRIEYKHFILSKALWNLDAQTLKLLLSADASLITEWEVVCKQLQIPRFIELRQGDNSLLIDGKSDFSVKILRDELRKKGKITITEFLECPDKMLLGKTGAYYTSEIIIPFLSGHHSSTLCKPIVQKHKVISEFMIGSEWLYLKIYCGTRVADMILTKVLSSLLRQLTKDSVIDKWFFIRYTDPDHHIRIRFHNTLNKNFWVTVIEEINSVFAPLLSEGTVQKIISDTYKRELQRYGTTSYKEIESIFFADSEAILSILESQNTYIRESDRWLIALKGVDLLLADLGMDLFGKKTLLEELKIAFHIEFKGNTELNCQLNNKFRKHSKAISQILGATDDGLSEFAPIMSIFALRSDMIKEPVERLLANSKIPLSNIASGIIHMFLNRIFIARQRTHELVIYHYLEKYYRSAWARENSRLNISNIYNPAN